MRSFLPDYSSQDTIASEIHDPLFCISQTGFRIACTQQDMLAFSWASVNLLWLLIIVLDFHLAKNNISKLYLISAMEMLMD